MLFAQKQMQSELKNPQKSVFNSKFIIFIFFGSEQIIKDIRIFSQIKQVKTNANERMEKKVGQYILLGFSVETCHCVSCVTDPIT